MKVQEAIDSKADANVVVDALQGDEVTGENIVKVHRYLLDKFVNVLPLGFVQLFEKATDSIEAKLKGK